MATHRFHGAKELIDSKRKRKKQLDLIMGSDNATSTKPKKKDKLSFVDRMRNKLKR